MEPSDQLVFKIALSLIPGIGNVTARNLIAYIGSVEEIFHEKEKTLMKIPGVGEINAQRVTGQNVLERAKREVDFILRNRIQTFFYLDENYPTRLKNCSDAPIILYFRGKANLNEQRIISIVGTRNATTYGKEMCDELIESFSKQNYPLLVVSGLAYGIDVQAHKACLKYEIPTVGVFAHGLDMMYPALHGSIAAKMLEKGGLITDFASETKIDRQNFLRRNRIIAGLADAVIVVESAEKGGALVTANIANSYNRDVFAFPGRCNDPFSKGCNNLIKTNQAILIENYLDIEKAMNWDTTASASRAIQTSLFVDLTVEEQKLVDLLKGGDRSIDEITIETQMPMNKVSVLFFELELKGLVTSLPGKMYKLK